MSVGRTHTQEALMSQSPSRRRRTARRLGVLLAGAVATAALFVPPCLVGAELPRGCA